MKDYFKKSDVFDKYNEEREHEREEDSANSDLSAEVGGMKRKFTDLMGKFTNL